MRDEAGFRTFVEANGATLLHAARLLTGDHHRGEDLVQTALTKVYLKWGRVDAPLRLRPQGAGQRAHRPEPPQWWGERPTEMLPETSAPAGEVRPPTSATSCAACSPACPPATAR